MDELHVILIAYRIIMEQEIPFNKESSLTTSKKTEKNKKQPMPRSNFYLDKISN